MERELRVGGWGSRRSQRADSARRLVRGSEGEDLLGRLHDLRHLLSHARLALDTRDPSQVDAARESLDACIRLTSSAPTLERDVVSEPVRIRELVESEARRAIAARRTSARIRIYAQAPDALESRVPLDPLARLVRNLLLNAIEASFDGGVVRVRAWIAEGTTYLEVRDEGRGLDGASRAGLYAGDTTIEARGRGHGRESVRLCVLRLGAIIQIDGAPGRGVVVTLSWQDTPAYQRAALLADASNVRDRIVSELRDDGLAVQSTQDALTLLRSGHAACVGHWIVQRGFDGLVAEDWRRLAEARVRVESARLG